MTDGTSQGLFIVVAIVIFGIFTLMAYILFEDTLSPALANMFTDSFDKVVEDTSPYTDEKWFTFDRSSKTITGFNPEDLTDYPKELRIPSSIKGVPVRHIGSNAFLNLTFDSIAIPNSVQIISERAFKNTRMKKLDLGNSVKEIKEAAFINDNDNHWGDLPEITLPDSLEIVGQSAFDNRKITNILGGKGVREIHSAAFQNAVLTGTLEFPKLEALNSGAFRDSKLDTIITPDTATIISSWTNYDTVIVKR